MASIVTDALTGVTMLVLVFLAQLELVVLAVGDGLRVLRQLLVG